MDLTNRFRTLHLKAAENTFFSSAHGTFSRIDHILGHKSALSKYKKIKIIPCIFSDHNAMKLEINHKKKIWKGNKYLETKEHPYYRMNGLINNLNRKLKSTWKPMKMITPQQIGRASCRERV